jgi:copper(I)-binding protein
MLRQHQASSAAVEVALALAILLALAACGEANAPAAPPTRFAATAHSATAPTEPAQVTSTGTETPASGVGAEETIRIVDPWARAAIQMGGTPTSAVYLIIRNEGEEADRLLGAESDAAQTVELHQSKMEGGTMKMEPVQAIDIPPGGQVELKPGGLHIMLIGLKRDLPAGERLTLVLHFERSGDIEVEAEVRQP